VKNINVDISFVILIPISDPACESSFHIFISEPQSAGLGFGNNSLRQPCKAITKYDGSIL